jgi:signal transduction histidine kinase
LAQIFLGGIPALIIALIALGAWIVRRTMAPLVAVAEAAQRISPAVPGERLRLEQVPSKVLPVVVAANAALDRLQGAFEMQQRFIANAAHELRTPIATFRAAVERLPESPGKAALVGDVERLTRLTSQLLDLARAERVGDLQPVDVVPVARHVAVELAPMAAAKGVAIGSEPPASLIVNGIAEHLHAILRNLIENAISHAPQGTEVRILADGAKLMVEDHGRAFQQQCGWPFLSVSRAARGPMPKAAASACP